MDNWTFTDKKQAAGAVNVLVNMFMFGLAMITPVHGVVVDIGNAVDPVKAILKKVADDGGGEDDMT
jgi:hypothetical protein